MLFAFAIGPNMYTQCDDKLPSLTSSRKHFQLFNKSKTPKESNFDVYEWTLLIVSRPRNCASSVTYGRHLRTDLQDKFASATRNYCYYDNLRNCLLIVSFVLTQFMKSFLSFSWMKRRELRRCLQPANLLSSSRSPNSHDLIFLLVNKQSVNYWIEWRKEREEREKRNHLGGNTKSKFNRDVARFACSIVKFYLFSKMNKKVMNIEKLKSSTSGDYAESSFKSQLPLEGNFTKWLNKFQPHARRSYKIDRFQMHG